MKPKATISKILMINGYLPFLKALLTWKIFSITSYKMMLAIQQLGICPAVIIDVGANVGQFSYSAAELFPNAQIYSFEPEPNIATKLRENLKGKGNVSIYPCALGDQTGEVTFHVNKYSLSSSVLPLAEAHQAAFPEAEEIRMINVPQETLDLVFAQIPLRSPILLKIDVQGYESSVIAGAKEFLKKADYVIVEVSFEPMYQGEMGFQDILRMMEENNFTFRCPVDVSTNARNSAYVQMDALFVRNTR